MGYFFQEKPLDGTKKTIVDPLINAAKTIADSNTKLNEIKAVLYEIDESASQVAKSFGQGREQITSIKAAMAEAADKIYLLGGYWKDVVDIQQAAATTLGRNVILAEGSYKKLYETAKVTGQSNEQLMKGFKDAGFSLYDVSNQMQKVMDTARSIGVNGQMVSKQVVENMSKMNQFNFQGGVEGLAKMAAQAVNLRVDMSSTLKVAEGLFSPEKAIEMAAAMQRLGVAQGDLLDPLKLMDLAQNDPAELQNQIAQMSKQFTQLNADGHFEILPDGKRQLMEISAELGISYGEMTKMALGGAELEQKMGKIKFPEFATKEQQEMLANITEMGANGDMKIKVDGKEMDINDAMEKFGTSPESFDKLIEASKPKTMETLAEEQLGTLNSIDGVVRSMSGVVARGLASTKLGTEVDDAGRMSGKGLAKTFEPFSSKNIGGVIGDVSEKFMTSIINGENGVTALGTAATTLSTFFNDNFNKSLDTAKTELDKLGNSSNTVLQFMETIIKKAGGVVAEHENVTPADDFIRFPGETVEYNPQDTIVGLTEGKKAIENLNSTNTRSNVNPPLSSSNAEALRTMGVGTNPMGGNSDVASKNTGPIVVSLNIKLDAPSHVDTAQLLLAFNDQTVKQGIISAVGTAANNANGKGESNDSVETRKKYNV